MHCTFTGWTARLILAAIALGLSGLAVAPVVGRAQADDLLIRVVSPEEAKKGDKGIVVQINAENADNLASFQFDLKFDSDILEVSVEEGTDKPLIQRGEFLGSTGREVVCDEPESQRGVVRFVCITLRLEPEGAVGAGTLATVTFKATGTGATELTLDKVVANHPDGEEIPLQVQGGTIAVTGDSGSNWLLWGGIAAAVLIVVLGGGAFAATRMGGRSSTAA